jgi:hypothetical protein
MKGACRNNLKQYVHISHSLISHSAYILKICANMTTLVWIMPACSVLIECTLIAKSVTFKNSRAYTQIQSYFIFGFWKKATIMHVHPIFG